MNDEEMEIKKQFLDGLETRARELNDAIERGIEYAVRLGKKLDENLEKAERLKSLMED